MLPPEGVFSYLFLLYVLPLSVSLYTLASNAFAFRGLVLPSSPHFMSGEEGNTTLLKTTAWEAKFIREREASFTLCNRILHIAIN